MERKSFLFYKEWRDAIKDLPDDVRLDIYESIIEYATTGNIKGLKPMASIAFKFTKQRIDSDFKKYIDVCEIHRESGRKGGRPKNQKVNLETKQNQKVNLETKQNQKVNLETKQNQTKPKKPDNDYDNDNDLKKEEFPNVNSLSNCKQPDSLGFQNSQHVSIDFEKLICWFNEATKGVFGVIRSPLGEKRKKMLRARILEHGKESFVEVVNNAVNSDFMRGQNSRGWTATFDWLIKPANYEKVLSENFKNQQNGESIQRANGTGNKRPTPDELNAAVEIGLALAAGAKNG